LTQKSYFANLKLGIKDRGKLCNKTVFFTLNLSLHINKTEQKLIPPRKRNGRYWLFLLLLIPLIAIGGFNLSKTRSATTILGGETSLSKEALTKLGSILNPMASTPNQYQEEDLTFVFGGQIANSDELNDSGPPLVYFNTFLGQRAPFVTEGSPAHTLGIKSYEVQPGDTPASIAKHFNVTVETVLAVNDLRYGDYISPGEVLLILPVSGVLHKIQSYESLSDIASRYSVASDEIAKYNLLAADGSNLEEGQLIIVPNGKKYIGVAPPAYGKSLANYDDYYSFPTTGRNWGRMHDDNGVDISNSCGTEIFSAASGRVIEVSVSESRSSRLNGGYGNLIKIVHSNGTTTLYGHLLAALVNVGDQVSKGQLVAWMGGRPGSPGAGNSTGCHVHFEVRGARNPFVRYY